MAALWRRPLSLGGCDQRKLPVCPQAVWKLGEVFYDRAESGLISFFQLP